MGKRLVNYLALALMVWAISSTIVAGYYFVQWSIYQSEYENLAIQLSRLSNAVEGLSDEIESTLLRVDVLLSYGNGTKSWYNNTVLPLGSTAFTAILTVADIEYTDYGGDLGILVNSINGLTSNSTHGWLYWYWDADNFKWIIPEYSCAKYILHKGNVIAFAYEDYMTWPPPAPN